MSYKDFLQIQDDIRTAQYVELMPKFFHQNIGGTKFTIGQKINAFLDENSWIESRVTGINIEGNMFVYSIEHSDRLFYESELEERK